MNDSKKVYYIVYKTTNKINGKIYIGSHKTRNINDSYLGSGTILKKAISKYGEKNFKKEILFVFDNAGDMYKKEAELVNDEFLEEENTYNLKTGGEGGFDYINNHPEICLTEKRLNSLITQKDALERWKKKFREDDKFKEYVINKAKKLYLYSKEKNPEGAFFGRKHTENTKRIMSEKAKLRLKDPTKNSQYGTMWITDGINNKKILKSEKIPFGWNKGRNLGRVVK